MSIDMSQFFQVFFDESAEHLAEMERLLLEMDVDSPDIEEMNAIFRAAHSIKGGSGTFGFTDMTDVTHVLENLLDRLRKGEMLPRSEMIDVFLEAADVLKNQLACHTSGTDADPEPAATVCEKLRALANMEQAPAAPVAAAAAVPEFTEVEQNSSADVKTTEPPLHSYDITFRPRQDFFHRSSAMEELVTELTRLGTVEIISLPPVAEFEKTSGKDKKGKKDKKDKKASKSTTVVAEWKFSLTTTSSLNTIQEVFAFIAAPDEVVILQRPVSDLPASDSEVLTAAKSGDADENAEDGGYGFFKALEPVEADENTGYGFFIDSPSPAEVDDELEDGFGFFAPLPSQQAEGEQGDGFGFFAPLAPPDPEGEQGDGFGFFAPLPAPAANSSAPAAVINKPQPSAVTKPKEKAPTPAASGETSIRVSVERVDQLMDLVGELVITQAMLAQTVADVDPVAFATLHNGLAQLQRNTRDMQESVMSIRMMPISFVFSRFPRVVRDLASKLNKQVELVTIGETTELDKGLIEKIADPLTHLVRNSLDHGIESPEKRIAAGKPAKGTITLSASHQGGSIAIEVTDDGAGLNREKILSKAMERGLNASESMPDNEVWMLIFEPGFSTAEVVTDVSGRGVGMDVVKRNITEMGGVVTITSVTGYGSTMTIRLPLTLAILDGMSVSLGDNVYVIPLNMIVETMQPKPEDIKTVTGQGRMVQVRGEYLPIIALHKIFDMPTEITDPCDGVLVLIESQGKKAALFMDTLVGQQQVVIKSLETNFRKIVGVSGATIMGDGTVALILDVAMLIKMGQ